MITRYMRAVAATLALCFAGCATSRPDVSVLGRNVDVRPSTKGDDLGAAKGELVAVGSEQLWVMEPTGVREVPLPRIDHVRVKRHDWGGRRAWVWTLVGALATGGTLMASCASVEGTDNCAGVGAGVGLTWLLFGGLSAASLESSSVERVRGPRFEALKPYARFPQGLPERLDPKEPER